MTEPTHPATIVPAGSEELAAVLALPQQQKVVLVMDLVESVRLMEADEGRVISHWRHFVRYAAEVLPRHGGRLVKSLGDGIMVEFDSPREAVAATLGLQRFFDGVNAEAAAEERFYLRAGLNATRVFVDGLDIYGSGVNLAARVATLAGPGETMVTAEVRAGLLEGVDVDTEDMGDCHLKHVAEPVRIYRVGNAGPRPLLVPSAEYLDPLQPTVAVIPFEARNLDTHGLAVGELIADGVIANLGVNTSLHVVSKLSSSCFSGRDPKLARQVLGAAYVLVGSFVLDGPTESGVTSVLVHGSLLCADTGEVIWIDRFTFRLADLWAVESEACLRLATGVQTAILNSAAAAAARQPLPTLASYSLLLSGIHLMHRSTSADMTLSRRMLEHLAERHPRHAEPYAWLAKSFVISAVSSSRHATPDTERARAISHHALERFPENALALSVQAHVLTQLEARPDQAQEKIASALRVNYNEPLAWLFKSVLSAMWGDPRAAVEEAARAHALSPADPLGYYFKMIHAAALASNEDFANALLLSRESLRLNRYHTPTWRVLIASQFFSGDMEGAEVSAREMLRLDPSFSLRAYKATSTATSRTRRLFVRAATELPILKSTA